MKNTLKTNLLIIAGCWVVLFFIPLGVMILAMASALIGNFPESVQGSYGNTLAANWGVYEAYYNSPGGWGRVMLFGPLILAALVNVFIVCGRDLAKKIDAAAKHMTPEQAEEWDELTDRMSSRERAATERPDLWKARCAAYAAYQATPTSSPRLWGKIVLWGLSATGVAALIHPAAATITFLATVLCVVLREIESDGCSSMLTHLRALKTTKAN
jgi:hypothetical protein